MAQVTRVASPPEPERVTLDLFLIGRRTGSVLFAASREPGAKQAYLSKGAINYTLDPVDLTSAKVTLTRRYARWAGFL